MEEALAFADTGFVAYSDVPDAQAPAHLVVTAAVGALRAAIAVVDTHALDAAPDTVPAAGVQKTRLHLHVLGSTVDDIAHVCCAHTSPMHCTAPHTHACTRGQGGSGTARRHSALTQRMDSALTRGARVVALATLDPAPPQSTAAARDLARRLLACTAVPQTPPPPRRTTTTPGRRRAGDALQATPLAKRMAGLALATPPAAALDRATEQLRMRDALIAAQGQRIAALERDLARAHADLLCAQERVLHLEEHRRVLLRRLAAPAPAAPAAAPAPSESSDVTPSG